MHVGEGTVFLIFLSLGILKIYSTRKRENELARLQSNFLLSVTHELKSPLASVKLQLQTLQKHTLDETTKNKLLQKALADNERLLRMIDNVLLASRAEERNNVLKKLQKINIPATISKLIDQAFEENKSRIKLNFIEPIFVEADEQFISIIFSNLIENALKYSPANSLIEIDARYKNNKPMVSVKDQGAGIADAEKEKVFTKFYRIGNEETRFAKGTGLGLFITKNLCDLHHIQININDNKPQGTIFTLAFS
jgi:signal transduction histidine kinase